MDVLTTVAIASTVLSAVAFLLYKLWNKDEDTFAKAMAANKITLLEDVAPAKKAGSTAAADKKEKEKQARKKEEKKKIKAAASADSKEDKPAAAPAKEETSPKPKPVSPPAAAAAPKPKPEEPKKKETAAEPVAVKKEEAAPLQTSPAVPEQKKPAQSNGDKKANKKASPNKQVEDIENEEEFVEAKTKKTKKTEKKEAAPVPSAESTAPRHLSLKDLDTNKVVARLSTIDEIEVEYIDYLNNFFHETAATAARVVVDGARAARQSEEAARALATSKNEKTKLEGELESNRRTVHELANKAAAAASAEAELKSKLAALGPEMDKLRREAESSKKAAAAAAAAAAAVVIPVVPDNKEELEKAKAAEKSALARVSDLEEQLRNTKESAAKERKQLEQSVLQQKTREDAAVGQEVLLAESRQNAKAISQRLTELEQVKEQLEARLSDAAKQADELKDQIKQRDATHAADTLGFKKMIEDLNKEVLHFETVKKEQAEMVAKLAAKEAELTKKCAALEQAEQQITAIKQGSATSSTAAEAQIATLTKRVAELEQELKLAAEVVIPAAAPEPKKADIEEVVELKKSAYLNAAPPAASADHSAELEALKKENARLQEKNESLRADKHALCDQMTALEKRVVVANGSPAAPSTSTASEEKQPAAVGGGSKKGKKGAAVKKEEVKETAAAPAVVEKKDEEERVRAERRLVVSHIGKLIGGGSTPALDDSADTKSYESWLQSVAASIKAAQQQQLEKEKAKKSSQKTAAPAPAPSASAADDEEKEALRAENEGYREALDNLLAELHTIEQLKSEAEKANGKAH